jgi:hypothetical protein|tara:strand:- start:698 stop:985 length:288 start_codon:yes stop_codon:yes gene_type:complete
VLSKSPSSGYRVFFCHSRAEKAYLSPTLIFSLGNFSGSIKGICIGMGIDKVLKILALSVLLGSGQAVAADCKTGLKAYRSGDYKTALVEWIPLAN